MKALLIQPRIGDPSTGLPVAIDVRYVAGKAEICNLTIPCDVEGHIGPDGVLMLIAYLKRIVEPYADSER
jgi:hypothetical protein